MEKNLYKWIDTIFALLGIFIFICIAFLIWVVAPEQDIEPYNKIAILINNLATPILSLMAILAAIIVFKFQYKQLLDNERKANLRIYQDRLENIIIQTQNLMVSPLKIRTNKVGIKFRKKSLDQPENSLHVYSNLSSISNTYNKMKEFITYDDHELLKHSWASLHHLINESHANGYIHITEVENLRKQISLPPSINVKKREYSGSSS